MKWFEDIPKIFKVILVLILVISATTFILTTDFGNPAKSQENLEKTTKFMADNTVPTEISWISKIVEKIGNHPFLLFFIMLVIFWLFGYFSKKNKNTY